MSVSTPKSEKNENHITYLYNQLRRIDCHIRRYHLLCRFRDHCNWLQLHMQLSRTTKNRTCYVVQIYVKASLCNWLVYKLTKIAKLTPPPPPPNIRQKRRKQLSFKIKLWLFYWKEERNVLLLLSVIKTLGWHFSSSFRNN